MKNLVLFIFFLSNTVFSQNRSILWEAKKDSVSIFILGSNHLYPIDSISNKEKVNKIISESDVFFTELNPNSDAVDSIFSSRKNNNIKKKLGNSYTIYTSLFPDYKYLDKLTSKEIWFKLYKKKIELSCQYNGSQKMEDYFSDRARDKKTIEFEDSQEQLNQIDKAFTSTDNQMWEYIKNLLHKIHEKDLNSECVDGAKITNNNYQFEFNKITSKENKQTWDDRNIKWLDKLEKEISENHYKNIFVMVGIGHLDYSNGLVMLLKNKGFIVKPIIL